MAKLDWSNKRRRREWNSSGASYAAKPRSAVDIARRRVAICLSDLKNHRGNRDVKKRRLAHARAALLQAKRDAQANRAH